MRDCCPRQAPEIVCLLREKALPTNARDIFQGSLGDVQCVLYQDCGVRLVTGIEDDSKCALNLGQLQLRRATQCLKIDRTPGTHEWEQDVQDEAHV